MSISSEWNALKAAWGIMILAFIGRVFISSQFQLTPDEALFWQTSRHALPAIPDLTVLPVQAVRLSSFLFGHTEPAVRLPAVAGLLLAGFYMALLTSSMFSWHTALHVTLLTQGILLFNLNSLIMSPYSLLLPCWAATCYHSVQAMHEHRTFDWLMTGFWFALGMLCSLTMMYLPVCLILCLILIRPFRVCLLYPGPWFGLLLGLAICLPVIFFHNDLNLLLIKQTDIKDLLRDFIPDIQSTLDFLVDQIILLTPVVMLLVLLSWLTGTARRNLNRADVQFLILTSLPVFLLYMIFPDVLYSGEKWSITAPYVSAVILTGGLFSTTRSSFKGRPTRRWILGMLTAYLVTVPLLLHIAFPTLPLPWKPSQVSLETQGWQQLGAEFADRRSEMPDPQNTFFFSMEPEISAELAFYIPGNPRTISLDRRSFDRQKDFLLKTMQLEGSNGLGLVGTRAAIDRTATFFNRVELVAELTLPGAVGKSKARPKAFYLIRGSGFRFP